MPDVQLIISYVFVHITLWIDYFYTIIITDIKILQLRNFKCSTTPEVPNLFGTMDQFRGRRIPAGWGGAGRAQGSGGRWSSSFPRPTVEWGWEETGGQERQSSGELSLLTGCGWGWGRQVTALRQALLTAWFLRRTQTRPAHPSK